MAHRPAVVLALLLFAVIGLACVEITKADAAATAAEGAVPASGPTSDDEIGNSDEDAANDDDVVEAPLGGPVPPGAFPPTAESPDSSKSGATTLQVSVGAGAAAAAVAGFFF